MTEHLPECRLGEPCDIDIAEHGFCSMQVEEQFFCIHCMGECICERLRSCEQRAIAAAVQRVQAIADDMNSGVDWNWDYDIDPTGMTRNPRVWIRESVAAIKGDQP